MTRLPARLLAGAALALLACAAAPSVRAQDDRARGVAAVVEAWRAAWEAQRLEPLMALHAADFRSGARDRAAFEEHKRRLFARGESLTIALGDLEVGERTVGGETLVSATFLQDYRSASLVDFGRKELLLRPIERSPGYEIVRETWTAAPGPLSRPLAAWLASPAPAAPAPQAEAAAPAASPSPSDLEPLVQAPYAPPVAAPSASASGSDDLLSMVPLTRELPPFSGPIPGMPADEGPTRVVEEIVLRVNGRVLTRSDFLELVSFNQDELFRVDPPDLEQQLESVAKDTLDGTIERWLLVEQAKNWRFDTEVLWQEFVQEQQRQFDLASEQEVRAFLAEQGYPVALLKQLVVERQLSGAVLRQEVGERIDTSDTAVRTWFEEHRDRYRTPQLVTIRQILIPVAEGADPARAATIAGQVLEDLRAGADWCELAATYGAPGAPCGELGEVSPSDLNPELRALAEGLPVGATSTPVRTAAGVHLVQVTARRGGEEVALAEVLDRVRKDLYDEQFAKELEVYLAQLRADGQVEVNPRWAASLGVDETGAPAGAGQ